MDLLIPVEKAADILPTVRDTPIDALLRYHNLGAPHFTYHKAELLVGMCMDHRERHRVEDHRLYHIQEDAVQTRVDSLASVRRLIAS